MKSAVITGATKGIGLATARLFRKEGYFVFLHGRNTKELEALEKELGQKDSIVAGDLSSNSDIDQIAKTVKDRVQFQNLKLICLVNNAGIFEPTPSTSMGQIDKWKSQFQVNLFSHVLLTEKLIPLLSEHAPSSIVNVSSTLGMRCAANLSAYSASKAAMISWTHTLALDLGTQDIRVNCVCPGIVDTAIHSFHHLPKDEKQRAKDSLKNSQPLGRIGESFEIADSIYFLASQKSKWTTGAVIAVDGGINLK